MSITRRNLIQISGTAAGVAAMPGSLEAFDEFFKPAVAAEPNVSTIVTCCGVCSPACGLQATVQDGVVKFIEGLPGDAHGEGHLCGKGAAGARFLVRS